MIDWLDGIYARVWREHDLEGAFEEFPEDFEWVVPGFPGSELARGPRATAAFFRDWIDQWDDLEVDWQLSPAGPETVLALVRSTGRGRASGVPVTVEFAQVWTFRDGVPERSVLYADPAEARRAVGS